MNYIEINAENARYLSEVPNFEQGLPHGVINKVKTDVGATYLAANCLHNYIIVCPFVDLVESIVSDENNKYEVFRACKGFKKCELTYYLNNNSSYKKIAVTYDSFEKLTNWINPADYKVLVDEYHLIIEDMDFRESAITSLMCTISKYSHFSFLSATPINEELEIEFIKQLPHYVIKWNNTIMIKPMRYKVPNLVKGLTNFINIFLEDPFKLPDINGNESEVEELYIFFNSVKCIKQVLDSLELEEDLVKICCADKKYNHLMLGNYHISPVSAPNKKLNFFTKKCFQGCNLFTNNGLIIVASDGKQEHTLVDVSTTMEQIAGRIRYSEKSQNIFRDRLVHLYSTNKIMPSDEEFEEMMAQKEEDAKELINMTASFTKRQLNIFLDRVNLDADIVSFEDDKLVYNELKKQSLIFKQKLRKSYRDGLQVTGAYNESNKFVTSKQYYWNKFEVVLKKATTVSYEILLKTYLETKDKSFLEEYPEFEEIVKYISPTEMNSLDYNKEKMLKLIEDRKKLLQIFYNIHKEGFVSLSNIKAAIINNFNKYNITSISPKATLIENNGLYSATPTRQTINGKQIRGYILGSINKFKIS